MPGLQAAFRARVSEAMKLAEVGEVARAEAAPGSKTERDLYPARLEYLYELTYLRIFVAWEHFLEQAFLRYLCGYASKVGAAVPATGTTFQATLATAEVAVLAGRDYVLWHNPNAVTLRAQKFFASSPIETVVRSNSARLEHFAAIRHRVTHAQSDARKKFDLATMALVGKRYRGSRAGAFLRDLDPTVSPPQPPQRWVDQLGRELQNLAAQIA